MRMITILISLVLTASGALAAEVAQIVGGVEIARKPLPCSIGSISVSAPGRLTADAIAAGWRDVVIASATGAVKAATWSDTGTRWVQTFTVYTQAELDAASNAAASNAAAAAVAPETVRLGKATLVTHADGSLELRGPILVCGYTNGVYELVIDSETGLVMADLDHASPRKTPEAKAAMKAERKAKIAAVRAAATDKAKLDALLDLFGLLR